MDTPHEHYHYPNQMARIIFLASEEILGQNGMKVISHLAGLSEFLDHYPPNNQKLEFSFEQVSRLQSALEESYGYHGWRGVALRIGRACFQHVLREYGPTFGLTDIAFRLLPLRAKLKIGTGAFAEIFNRYTDQRVHLEDAGSLLLWQIERCPLCWERHSDRPACQMAVGLIQESLHWASGGKFFDVQESNCIAKGDPNCTIVIDKTPTS
jgi:predicted hydrocarbon binding protein